MLGPGHVRPYIAPVRDRQAVGLAAPRPHPGGFLKGLVFVIVPPTWTVTASQEWRAACSATCLRPGENCRLFAARPVSVPW
jgi:hypothetical protein